MDRKMIDKFKLTEDVLHSYGECINKYKVYKFKDFPLLRISTFNWLRDEDLRELDMFFILASFRKSNRYLLITHKLMMLGEKDIVYLELETIEDEVIKYYNDNK